MPQRVVLIFNIGPPFGNFRIAMRPGVFGVDHPAAFDALEEAIEEAFSILSFHSPDAWPELHAAGDVTLPPPRFDGREGVLNIAGNPSDASGGWVVMRAMLPFSGWPPGGWAVYEAWHYEPDGTWNAFSEEELETVW